MNLKGRMKKLQTAIVKTGLVIKVNTRQFYSAEQKRMITSYSITTPAECYLERKKNYFDMDRIVKEVGTVYVWYARYTSKLPKSEENIPDVWQYTSKGSLPGVNGNVDMNEFYTDFSLEDERVAENVEVTCNINIQTFQRAANADGYKDQSGNALVEDGIDGPKTQYVRKKIFLKARAYLFVGSTGELVKWWQQRLNEVMGLELEVDGKFGRATRAATIKFQERFGLVVDGIAGYDTLQMAFYN